MPFGWFKKKTPNLEASNLIEAAGSLVADYGDFIANDKNGLAIQDERRLPYPKQAILNALILIIAGQKATDEVRSAAIALASTLAYFQKDVGDFPVYQLGLDIAQFDVGSMSGENLASLLTDNPAGKAHYDRFFPLVEADLKRINSRVDEANRLRSLRNTA